LPVAANRQPAYRRRLASAVLLQRAAALALAAATLAVIATFPLARWPVGIVALASAVVTLTVRSAWAFLLPALIPLVDLTPWSGRFFFDEFDICATAILSALLWRPASEPADRTPAFDALAMVFLAGLAASYAWGVAFTLGQASADSLTLYGGYQSPLNALRLAKPLAYALAILGAAASVGELGEVARRRFARGAAVGLGLLIGHVVVERWRFPGLFDFTSDFRAVGPFATMHTGGAAIDAYVLMAGPLIACCGSGGRRAGRRLAVAGLILGTAYVVLATVTRATLAIAAAQFLVVMFARAWRSKTTAVRGGMAVTAVLLLAAGIASAATAPFWRERAASIAGDWTIRTQHWRDAWAMSGSSMRTRWWGAGTGSFRGAYRSFKHGTGASDFGLVREAGNQQLTLGGSSGIFYGQFVQVAPHTPYTLRLSVRGLTSDSSLSFAMCEKTMLNSYRCVSDSIATARPGEWRRREIPIDSGDLAVAPSGFRLGVRPVSLAFFVTGVGAVELDDIELVDLHGRDLLRNGNFERGHDHWFFTSDDHLAWHAKNVYLHVLVEHGCVGLAMFLVTTGLAILRVSRRAWAGDLDALAWCCSLLGVLALGIFDSIINAPRIAIMYFLLVGLAVTTFGAGMHAAGRAE
jgi:hypothetical protein